MSPVRRSCGRVRGIFRAPAPESLVLFGELSGEVGADEEAGHVPRLQAVRPSEPASEADDMQHVQEFIDGAKRLVTSAIEETHEALSAEAAAKSDIAA